MTIRIALAQVTSTDLLVIDLDLDTVDAVRRSLPVLANRRIRAVL
jgi:predicted amidohydrolase